MKYNRNVYQALMMISQFGINMLVPIFLCTFSPPQTRRRSARTENGAGAGNAPAAGETDAKKEAE